jgi:hypothetical protein
LNWEEKNFTGDQSGSFQISVICVHQWSVLV